MAIDSRNPQYENMRPLWEIMTDALAGERQIKRRNELYLPKPGGFIQAENEAVTTAEKRSARSLYNGYKQRAQFPEWVVDARRAMVGLVSRLEPEINLPPRLEELRENCTADGFSLWQLFLRAMREALAYGRLALVVDVDDSGAPFLVLYDAQSAINWKETVCNGRKRLTLAVFEEQADVAYDEFSHETATRYRVYSLHPDTGNVYVRVMDEGGRLVEEATPTTHVATGLTELPIVFCGATDNTPDVDEIPLLSMARASLKFYQVSADYFASLFYTSHPQPWISGIGDSDVVDITVSGPSTVWELPPDAHTGYLEFTGAGIKANREEMTAQKNAGFESGARAMDIGAQESGEARKARQNDQRATLSTVVSAVAESIETALRLAAQWVGADPAAVTFSVPPEFSAEGPDSAVLASIQAMVLADRVSSDAYWTYLQTGKVPERTYDEERAFIENTNPGDIPLGDS